MPPVLMVEGLDAYYGTAQALYGVSLQVGEGEIVTLVGANGAGKSTLLRAISGLLPVRGSIRLAGVEITGKPPEEVVRLGAAHVPEGRRIFPGMTVIENLEVAGYALGLSRRRVQAGIERVLETFPALRARARSYGWSLSGGEQQMLAIGRGLMASPRLLLLDEPSLGLAPRLIHEVFRVILRIRQMGTTVLLVEQNAAGALALADRGYVMANGRVVREGPGKVLLNDPEVVSSYLGTLRHSIGPAGG